MSNENIIKIFVIAVGIIAVGILLASFMWARRRKANRKRARRIKISLLTIGLVLVFAANGAILKFNVVIGQFLSKATIDQSRLSEVRNDSKDLTEKIQDEGSVLLKNENNALPLDISNSKEMNVNVFGQSSVKLTYGGSGSGSADISKNITLQQGLENAGFNVNTELTDFYDSHKPAEEKTNIFNLNGGDYKLSEPDESDFTDELKDDARKFSDVAIVTISRNGGEGGDLPMDMSDYTGESDKHYLELSTQERQMIDMVKSMNFKKVIVLVNSSNAMELGFLNEEGIDAALWIGGPGSTGCNSIGNILSGKVNPSGRLVDTYAYDLTTAPSYYNLGDFRYDNTSYENRKIKDDKHAFVNYQEGIYVGYRYYETRFIDNKTGKCDEEAYKKTVQYPFGYGLSYTDFKQEIEDYEADDNNIEVKVRVTNTGKTAGKDTVQLYYTPPYYENGIEKAHVVLAGFDKTKELQPNESQIVTIKFKAEDMASYDYKDAKAYVLDQGKYTIKLMNNAHEVIDSRDYTVNNKIVYSGDNKRTSDKEVVTNQFDYAEGDVNYVSRADFDKTLPKERTANKDASDQIVNEIENPEIKNNDSDADITTNKKNNIKLKDMTGLDYDDPKWNDLLDEVSVDEMKKLIGFGGYATQAVRSIDKPATSDLDGPAGINGLVNGVTGTQYNSEVVIASTWNKDIAKQMGECFGDEAVANRVTGIYAPAVNIHRSPLAGRNFEYYSEDPVISGDMAENVISGAASKGVYCYLKHFALNNQEDNRHGICTWANEQAIREIYLKAFEIPVKEADTKAIMSSFNRIGTKWCGGNYELLTNVLRNEWGFKGMVITDYFGGGYMNQDQALRAGNDLMLSTMGAEPTEATTGTNTGKQAMRQATKDILYTVANSKGMELASNAVPLWIIALGIGDLVLLALLLLGFYKSTHEKNRLISNEENRSL